MGKWPDEDSTNSKFNSKWAIPHLFPIPNMRYRWQKQLWGNPFNMCSNMKSTTFSSVFSANWCSLLLWRGRVVCCWTPTGGSCMSSTCGGSSLWSNITWPRIPFVNFCFCQILWNTHLRFVLFQALQLSPELWTLSGFGPVLREAIF